MLSLVAAQVHGAGVSAFFGSAQCTMFGLCGQAWDLEGLRDDAKSSRWGWGDPHGSTRIHTDPHGSMVTMVESRHEYHMSQR
jgi:hypothetical protein